MSKHRYTARIQDIRLSQIAHQRGGMMVIDGGLSVIDGYRYNGQGDTPDNTDNRFMRRLAKRTLRRERKL
ncbi:hypothetical protein H2549_002430 [Salmonella enterica subsp. enterica serovar Stanley]|nr:hypothetical protein [Salmonella enterica subsp. enterica serovar Stanley]